MVKQAMYKLAAPPAEVTEGKPYVKPPELAPEQSDVNTNPATGMNRGMQEMLERGRLRGRQNHENFVEEAGPPKPFDNVNNIRLRNFVHPEAPITEKHYPKAYKELQQLKPHLQAVDDWASRSFTNFDITAPHIQTYNETGHFDLTTPQPGMPSLFDLYTNSYKQDYINLGNNIGDAANDIARHPVTKGVNNALARLATPKTVQPKPNPAAPVKPLASKAPTPNLPAIPDTPPNIRRLGGGKNY